jgi:hypothetical protein
VAVLVAALLAGACGEPTIPPASAQALQLRVARIRSAVESGRVAAARARLATLTGEVSELLDSDVIDEGTAMEILDAAEAVRAALGLAPSPSPTVTETTTPPPPPDEREDDGNKGEGKGKGKGHGDEGHGNDGD